MTTYRIEVTGVLGDKHLTGCRYTNREDARAMVRFYNAEGFYTGLRMAIVQARVIVVEGR